MSERYDAIVIGAGPAGEVCAGELADGGMRVAIVERELVAGECSYWACIPSKTLLRPGEAISAALQAPGARQAIVGPIDIGQALAWRDFMVADWDDGGQVGWLDSKGIELIRGSARIDGPARVVVGDAAYETERIVIATGSEPLMPPIPGLAELDGLWTNREATAVEELPDRLLVLGGGVVGAELSQALARMGVRVTLVEGESRLLPREAPALRETIATALAAVGASEGPLTGTAALAGVARTSTYTREYAERPGFLTVIADGEKLIGAFAAGPEAGEWLQQATLAIRAEVPLKVLRDTIQPFPTFSEAFVNALADLDAA